MSADRSAKLAYRVAFRAALTRHVWIGLVAVICTAVAVGLYAENISPTSRNVVPSLHVGLLVVWFCGALGAWRVAARGVRRARHAVAAAGSTTISAVATVGPTQKAWADSVMGIVHVATLVGPLSLHAVVALFTCRVVDTEFWGWAGLSFLLVTHVHIIGTVSVARVARNVVVGGPPQSMLDRYLRTVVMTTVAALIPGIVLLGIPVVVVAITGAVLYGVVFAWLAYRVVPEATARVVTAAVNASF